MIKNYDIAVVGGGMVGLAFALALKDSGLSIAVIDADSGDKALGNEPELRVSAINLASQHVLENIGVWEAIVEGRHQPYMSMDVWDKDSFGSIQFDQKDVLQPQLGFIIENQAIRYAMWQAASQADNIGLHAHSKIKTLNVGQKECFISLENDQVLTAQLIIGADGANSYVRQQAALPVTFWDYEHHAIVATVETELPHQSCARQVFTPEGPLAFLPLYEANKCSIVWSQQVDRASELMSLDDEAFSKALTSALDTRLGLCKVISQRVTFPLKMRYARSWIKDRIALMGDAAHTIHPLAGQGVNLGFLDAAALAETILDLHKQGKDIGAAENLRSYERWRKAEAQKMIAAMEGFKRLFGGHDPFKKLLRDVGLSLVNKAPTAKNKIIRHAMGLEGDLPVLARS